MTRQLGIRSGPAVAGLALAAALALPPVGPFLESTLVGHMAVQIPSLVLAGVLLGRAVPIRWRQRYSALDPQGVLALLLALFTLAFWLLPRYLDLAVLNPLAGTIKVVTLVLLAGVPLGLGCTRLPLLLRGVLWVKGTAMLFVMGWLYREAPDRLCNAYLIGEQQLLGTMLMTAGVLSLTSILVFLLLGPPSAWDHAGSLRWIRLPHKVGTNPSDSS